MSRTDRSLSVLRTPVIIAPLLLALGGCAAVPIAELASSGAGNAGMMTAMQKFVPGLAPGQAGPCAASTDTTGANTTGGDGVRGCGTPPQQQTAASKTPAATPAMGPTTACDQNKTATAAAGCDTGGVGAIVQGLAGSLQKLSPSSLFSR